MPDSNSSETTVKSICAVNCNFASSDQVSSAAAYLTYKRPTFCQPQENLSDREVEENSFSVSFHRALNGTFGHCLGANMTHDLAPFLLFRGTFSYGRALHASRVPLPRLGWRGGWCCQGPPLVVFIQQEKQKKKC